MGLNHDKTGGRKSRDTLPAVKYFDGTVLSYSQCRTVTQSSWCNKTLDAKKLYTRTCLKYQAMPSESQW